MKKGDMLFISGSSIFLLAACFFPKPAYAEYRTAPVPRLVAQRRVSTTETFTVESIGMAYRLDTTRPRRQGEINILSRRLTSSEFNTALANAENANAVLNANAPQRIGLATRTQIRRVRQGIIPEWSQFSIASNYPLGLRLQPRNVSELVVQVPLDAIFSSTGAFSEVDFTSYSSKPRKVRFLNLNESSPHRLSDYADPLHAIRKAILQVFFSRRQLGLFDTLQRYQEAYNYSQENALKHLLIDIFHTFQNEPETEGSTPRRWTIQSYDANTRDLFFWNFQNPTIGDMARDNSTSPAPYEILLEKIQTASRQPFVD